MHMTDVVDPTSDCIIAFRGDARASGDTVGLGGWQCSVPEADAKWFAIELDRHSAPRAYSAGESFRRIASLELFTTLLCVMVLPSPDSRTTSWIQLAGETDNRRVIRLLSESWQLRGVRSFAS